jgi:hypothetical protein
MSRLLVLPSLVALLVLLHTPLSFSLSFSFPSDCALPTGDSCPFCCKNLHNVAAAGEPSKVVKNVKHVDKCIAICSNHTYWGLSNRHVCGCFDECRGIEVPPKPFKVTSGLVAACLAPCFDWDTSASRCPTHSSPLVGASGAATKCCCKAPFDTPVLIGGRPTCTRSASLSSVYQTSFQSR